MTFAETARAMAYAAQADKAAVRAQGMVEQTLVNLQRVNHVKAQVEQLLAQLHIPFRWIGTRLDLKGPDGEWVEGRDLRGSVSTDGAVTPGHFAVFADASGNLLGDGGEAAAANIPFAPAGGLTSTDVQAALIELEAEKAPLTSPEFSGAPTAPTPAADNNSTRIATTAFVKTALDALLDGAPGALDTLNELAAAVNDDASFAASVTTALSGKQPLNGNLTAFSGLAGAANKIAVFTGVSALALLSYGVSGANALLQLDATGKIPALDGSQLTNLVAVLKKPVITKSGNYTVTTAEAGKLIECTATLTLTLPSAATAGDGFVFSVCMTANGGVLTLLRAGSDQVDSATSVAAYIGDGIFDIISNGTSWRTTRRKGFIDVVKTTIGVAVALIDYETAFADTEMIGARFRFEGLSHDDGSSRQLIARVKKSGAYATSGYFGASTFSAGTTTTTLSNTTATGLGLTPSIAAATKAAGFVLVTGIQQAAAGAQSVSLVAGMNDQTGEAGAGATIPNANAAIQGIRFMSLGGNLDAGVIRQQMERG